jgi:hypothetical protein
MNAQEEAYPAEILAATFLSDNLAACRIDICAIFIL